MPPEGCREGQYTRSQMEEPGLEGQHLDCSPLFHVAFNGKILVNQPTPNKFGMCDPCPNLDRIHVTAILSAETEHRTNYPGTTSLLAQDSKQAEKTTCHVRVLGELLFSATTAMVNLYEP